MGKPIELTEKNLETARELLLRAVRVLDEAGIPYHLEGGTLLGLVRDGDLLPWDHDVDISVMAEDLPRLLACRSRLSGWKWIVRTRKGFVSNHPAVAKAPVRLVKVKDRVALFFSGRMCLDIFVKVEHEGSVYWEAKDRLMRVDARYYRSFEEVEYRGHRLKVPNAYRDYLTEKYGDWSVPVKEWDCAVDERTLVDPSKER